MDIIRFEEPIMWSKVDKFIRHKITEDIREHIDDYCVKYLIWDREDVVRMFLEEYNVITTISQAMKIIYNLEYRLVDLRIKTMKFLLEKHDYNTKAVADELGLHYSNTRLFIRRHGLHKLNSKLQTYGEKIADTLNAIMDNKIIIYDFLKTIEPLDKLGYINHSLFILYVLEKIENKELFSILHYSVSDILNNRTYITRGFEYTPLKSHTELRDNLFKVVIWHYYKYGLSLKTISNITGISRRALYYDTYAKEDILKLTDKDIEKMIKKIRITAFKFVDIKLFLEMKKLTDKI